MTNVFFPPSFLQALGQCLPRWQTHYLGQLYHKQGMYFMREFGQFFRVILLQMLEESKRVLEDLLDLKHHVFNSLQFKGHYIIHVLYWWSVWIVTVSALCFAFSIMVCFYHHVIKWNALCCFPILATWWVYPLEKEGGVLLDEEVRSFSKHLQILQSNGFSSLIYFNDRPNHSYVQRQNFESFA